MGCKRKESDEEDFRNVTEEIHSWMPNIWALDKPGTKLKNGMFADAEMVRNVPSSHEKGEGFLTKFLSKFTNSNSNSKSTRCIHLNHQRRSKKKKLHEQR